MTSTLSSTSTAGKVSGRVLVVDDHASARESMGDVLRRAGHRVDCCSSAAEALRAVEEEGYDCIVTDLKMPGMNGVELIIQLERRQYGAQLVMVTAHASVPTAVEAMRHGAFDYIEKPFDVDQLEQLVDQAIRHGRLVRRKGVFDGAPEGLEPPVMIGSSPPMQALRERIRQIAPTPETVLVHGETGTGKELVARELHAASPRGDGPLVSLNCPVLSAHLMESELFGHQRGAFTGADSPRIGRFELANGGSILLDEVTEIDLALQAKLLRVLQEKAFERVGSNESVRVDVRVLATTNRNLEAEVAAGRFRQDLYYRLAVVPLHVPPLRERREDVPELADHFLARCARRLHRAPCVLDPDARDLLATHDWPGNVRELENVVTRASVLSPGGPITAGQLKRWLLAAPGPRGRGPSAEVQVGLSLEEMERRLIEATLEHYGGHRANSAKALGIGVRTLTGKLRQYGYAPREKSFSKSSRNAS
jgi:DNA-binding NtrC family response regulator